MPLFHGIYSSSAPRDISVTICNPSTNNVPVRSVVRQKSPWHHPTLPEIRPFSLNLHILIDDKQNLRYYILRPPPDKEPFNALCLPTVSSVSRIRRCYGKAVVEGNHTEFGIQKLRDVNSGLCYTILTARFASDAPDPITAPDVTKSPQHPKQTPYVIRPAAELPQIIASGDLYPLEYGCQSLRVPVSALQFEKAYGAIYSWYMLSFPWLTIIRASGSVRMKALKDCQMLAQQCRWRTGGWLLDHHIQRFYGTERNKEPILPRGHDPATDDDLTDELVISPDPKDYIEGPWITDGLYKRTRIALRSKYIMEFPWFELSCLKRKVEYDIGFLHMALQLVGFPPNNRQAIHVKILQDKEVIKHYNAEVYDLAVPHSQESLLGAKEQRLQARVAKHVPHTNVDLGVIPQNWRKLMSIDE
ncbi:hypothetical protein DSL72_007366 [Monilinia vaccinii-corymbosi]|uniref:Uncharacterized protein n=1 Tax=Monilinia vaccinii-corymbosi TaxID=61207 RepID=A0A8A3PM90_9HELO|nr:hypothetical protein DSL72_007366 [Monilinia vaccinii-corymbosi]